MPCFDKSDFKRLKIAKPEVASTTPKQLQIKEALRVYKNPKFAHRLKLKQLHMKNISRNSVCMIGLNSSKQKQD